MRYRLTISPRPPRRLAGYLAGLWLLIAAVLGSLVVGGYVLPAVGHAAATAIVAFQP